MYNIILFWIDKIELQKCKWKSEIWVNPRNTGTLGAVSSFSLLIVRINIGWKFWETNSSMIWTTMTSSRKCGCGTTILFTSPSCIVLCQILASEPLSNMFRSQSITVFSLNTQTRKICVQSGLRCLLISSGKLSFSWIMPFQCSKHFRHKILSRPIHSNGLQAESESSLRWITDQAVDIILSWLLQIRGLGTISFGDYNTDFLVFL